MSARVALRLAAAAIVIGLVVAAWRLAHVSRAIRDPIRVGQRSLAPADLIVLGAQEQVQAEVGYDPAYRRIGYPGGDVPADRGACTDLVVRALRRAGIDLQRLIHEDAVRSPAAYPLVRRPDPSIDHRRVPNQIAFLGRHARALSLATTGSGAQQWLPGDIVYWKMPDGGDHCGIVSNAHRADGLPMVIHNLRGATEEDCLGAWRIVGHFRYPVASGSVQK